MYEALKMHFGCSVFLRICLAGNRGVLDAPAASAPATNLLPPNGWASHFHSQNLEAPTMRKITQHLHNCLFPADNGVSKVVLYKKAGHLGIRVHRTHGMKRAPVGIRKMHPWHWHISDREGEGVFLLASLLCDLNNTQKPILNQCSACPGLNPARDLEFDPYLEQVGEASNQEVQSGHFLPLITSDDRKTPVCGKRFQTISTLS